MVISDEPTNFTFVRNGKNMSPDVPIVLIEEELTNSYFSNDGRRSCEFHFAANQKDLKKFREVIEKENNDENNDPRFLPKANFIAATHLVKGSITYDHGCTMVNLRIEDRKGCVRAQKKISVSGMSMWQAVEKLTREAARSLGYQICNSEYNEQACSKSHYTDELFCPRYYAIRTVVEKQENSSTDRVDNVMIDGPKSLISSWNTVKESKQ